MSLRRPFRRPPLPALVAGMLIAAGPAWSAEDLRLEKVMLSTGGVGLFEHSALVDGPAILELTVRLDQVDDVLKSLTVSDPAGRPVSVDLAVREPLDDVFRALPIGPEALESPQALLGALRGAKVTIEGMAALSGRIVSVTPEETTDKEGNTQVRHRLGILSPGGLRQIILESANGIRFDDPDVAAAVETGLAALARHRERDSRTLAITLSDGGQRRVTASYVAEVPLWKAAWRLTLPPEQDGGAATGTGGTKATPSTSPADDTGPKARLAGWAVLENLSGTHWRNVSLSIVSGNPVTFRQDLYAPYRVERPQVPVEVYGRVLPPPDSGAVGGAADLAMNTHPRERAETEERVLSQPLRARSAMMDAPPAAAAKGFASQAPAPMALAGDAMTSGPMMGAIQAAPSERSEATAQVLFTLPHPVSLESGHTLMVPLVDEAIPVTRVAHFQPQVGGTHPLAAVRLTNATDNGLPPGAVTLYERKSGSGDENSDGLAYLGDARLDVLPAGDQRLLDFAVDQSVTVLHQEGRDRQVTGLTAARGVLRLRSVMRSKTTYTIRNTADTEKTVVIDHPKRSGWNLADLDDVTTQETADAHRLDLSLGAGETRTLAVVLEQPLEDRFQAGDLDSATLAAMQGGDGLSEQERDALTEAATLAARTQEYSRQLARLDQEAAAIAQDQSRVRDNLEAVPDNSDLHARYMDRLGSLEDRLVRIEQERTTAREESEKAQTALNDFIANLRLP